MIFEKMDIYTDIMTSELENCFAKQTFRISEKECAIAFVTLLDGLDIHLVYVDSGKYKQVQKITWDIFWTGISNINLSQNM